MRNGVGGWKGWGFHKDFAGGTKVWVVWYCSILMYIVVFFQVFHFSGLQIGSGKTAPVPLTSVDLHEARHHQKVLP